MTPKDKKIIKEAQENGTPIFVLSAKDEYATQAIIEYMKLCIKGNCVEKHIQGIVHRLEDFQNYKTEFPQNIKKPD